MLSLILCLKNLLRKQKNVGSAVQISIVSHRAKFITLASSSDGRQPRFEAAKQDDQIGRIFANWLIAFFGQFF
jgi:hypothetical protein